MTVSTQMEVPVDVTAARPEQAARERCLCDYISPLMLQLRRRPLFQKVIIANTFLLAIGMIVGSYLEKRYFEGGELSYLVLFVISGSSLSIFVNYLLVKLAFRPLDDVTETMRAIRAGHRDIRVPETTDDPQIEQLSKNLNSMLNFMQFQSKRAGASVIKAQEEERKRIARELHDETSQSLTGLVLGIRMIDKLVPHAMPEVKERLNHAMDLAHTTLNEVHNIAVRLRPSVLDDLGLSAALRTYVKEFSENTGISVDLQMLALAPRFSPELETVLYRVVQEALTNVARHSRADNCKVRLERRATRVHGLISDNGRGFDPQAVMMTKKGQGLGLHGMKERIELVGGSLLFDSHRGEGSRIQLEVPVASEEGFW